MGTTRSPKFLGNPYSHLPCSQTPAGPLRQAIQRIGAVPALQTAKTPAFSYISRLNHTAFAIAVYASRPWSPMVMQDSLPTAGQALSGWIGYQQGHYERFQLFRVRVLLSQALLGAIEVITESPLPVFPWVPASAPNDDQSDPGQKVLIKFGSHVHC